MVDALAVLISNPYLLHILSLSEKIFNGVKSYDRCFSRSHKYFTCVMYTF